MSGSVGVSSGARHLAGGAEKHKCFRFKLLLKSSLVCHCSASYLLGVPIARVLFAAKGAAYAVVITVKTVFYLAAKVQLNWKRLATEESISWPPMTFAFIWPM